MRTDSTIWTRGRRLKVGTNGSRIWTDNDFFTSDGSRVRTDDNFFIIVKITIVIQGMWTDAWRMGTDGWRMRTNEDLVAATLVRRIRFAPIGRHGYGRRLGR